MTNRTTEELPQAAGELTDAELERVAAGKELGSHGVGSNAHRGFPAGGYGNSRGYDMYDTHIG